MHPVIGVNPNKNVEDEYIHNLQQQMHFMELEIKLLKEKVIEDDEASGIGSLFNDEKYSEMRTEYLKKIEDIEKERIRISEEAFILDAQINILSGQNNKLSDIRDKVEDTRKAKIKELKDRLFHLLKERESLEKELIAMNRDFAVQSKNSYDYNIQLKNEEEDDAHAKYRHDRDLAQAEERYNQKLEALDKVNAALDDIQKQFEANPEYQANQETIDKAIEDAKNMYVEMNLLKRQVEEMKQAAELYKQAVEDEKNRKRRLIDINKNLKAESEAKQQTERMRMQKLMNETKDPELREYMLNSQKISDSIADLEDNLDNEKDKYDNLQNERVVLDRKTLELNEELDKNRGVKEGHDTDIPELKTQVKDLEAEVAELEKQQNAGITLNKEVEGKYRRLAWSNLALKAKLHFLLSKVDYSDSVKGLNLEDFRNLVSSNTNVNESIANFMERLTATKDEIYRFETEVEAKGGTI